MIIRAVLFDLDGTLVDSLGDLTDAVNHIRGVFSQAPLTTDAVRLKIGKGARHLIQQTLPGATDADINRALHIFLEFNKEHIADKSTLYPEITEVLHKIAAHGLKMAVISNKNEDLSTMMLQTLGIHKLFTSVCGGDTFTERKPSPLPLLKVAENLGISPFECIMVGDSINDIQAGQQANITSVACAWGYGSAEELAKADILVNTPQELLAVIAAGL